MAPTIYLQVERFAKVNWGLEGTSDIMVTQKLGVAKIAVLGAGQPQLKDCRGPARSTAIFVS